MKTIYNDLFEDEVADRLRCLPDRAEVAPDRYTTYQRKIGARYEDGLVESTDGTLYNHYIGNKLSGTIGLQSLLARLAHAEFTVEV